MTARSAGLSAPIGQRLRMELSELDFELPERLIAQEPLAKRSAARLLVVDREEGHSHQMVEDLPGLLPPSLFVVNETRVIPARLRGHKSTGGKCELLLVDPLSNPPGAPSAPRWRCLGTANKPLRAGAILRFGPIDAEVESREPGGILVVRFNASAEEFEARLDEIGEMPLPPYIQRPVSPSDAERYQTVFARLPGAVAAPTAGLHFDESLLGAMRSAGHSFARVVLHVGPGTFRPVQSESLDDHPMHSERFEVSSDAAEAIQAARQEGRAVVAVGTTVVRTLEASAEGDVVKPGAGDTALFIRPGYRPKVVDHLFTNFHLPRSTLLALAMAFGGQQTIRRAYEAAVEDEYRFFSYGDAMLIRGARS